MSKNISKSSLTNDGILEINEMLFFFLALLRPKAVAVLELLGGSLPGGGQKRISKFLLGIFLRFITGQPRNHPLAHTAGLGLSHLEQS